MIQVSVEVHVQHCRPITDIRSLRVMCYCCRDACGSYYPGTWSPIWDMHSYSGLLSYIEFLELYG